MDIQDHTIPTTHSGHQSHGVHTCHRCGWPFPNPHPSPKHRRAHKKICGTIEGYTNLIDSGVVSHDEHHSDEEEEKTPSPKIEKKIIKEGGSSGGIEERSNRSEDDLFSDAVTEFSDSGISPGVEERLVGSEKNLDGDSLQSFKDAENAGTTELLDSPMMVRKEDDVLEVFETPDSHTKDADKTKENDINTEWEITEAEVKLPETDAKASDPLADDRDESQKDKFIDPEPLTSVQTKPHPANTVVVSSSHVDEVSDKKEQGEAVNVLSVPSDIPLVDHSETLIHDFKDHETIYSKVPLILDADTFELKAGEEKSQTSHNGDPSVSEQKNSDLSAFVPTVVTEEVEVAEGQPLEMSKAVTESIDKLIEEKVSVNKQSVVAHDERTEVAVVAEEINKEIEQKRLESDQEQAQEVVEEAEIDHSVPVLTKEDLASEKCSEAYTREIVEEHRSGIEAEQEMVVSGDADSKDSGNVGISQRSEKLGVEETEQAPNASDVVSEAVVGGSSGKLMTSQDCGVSVGSSSRNSLEGNWGSVSVLSTASVDAENTHSIDKSAADKSRFGKSDVFEASPLVEPKEEIKPVAEQNSEQPPKSEAYRAGWTPSITNISNESEGRKRNEEAIAKVTNWSTGKHTTAPLKKPVGGAISPNSKQVSTAIQKDEVVEKTNEPGKSNLTSETPVANQELSPPKYVGEGKKVRKKAKGRVSWVPFACCSSVNVN